MGWRYALLVRSLLVLGPTGSGANPGIAEPWVDAGAANGMPRPGWISTSSADSGVPARLFVRAMTSLPPHYHDDHKELEAHLREEHAIFAALEAPGSSAGGLRRAHLCCTDYSDGPAVKAGLEVAAGGKRFVHTALNSNALGGYCAVAHMSSAGAAEVATGLMHGTLNVRCSPITHASKEPLSVLAPTTEPSSGDNTGDGAASRFGLRLGPGVQDGRSRGLVVTLSPGSLPVDADTSAAAEVAAAAGHTGGRGGGGTKTRKISPSFSAAELEKTWRAFWGHARGRAGAGALAETVPWTSSSAALAGGGGGGGTRRRSLLAGDGTSGRFSRAREFHTRKAAGYAAAIEHLGEKMEQVAGGGGEEGGSTLAGACGWESNLAFVYGREDLLFLRGIHHPDHDEATSAACFIGLVGFLSAQPEVMHIQPEPRVEANNKVLTAYIEGGEPTETPMRLAGVTGAGQIIGVTDTGLDDNSCFFKDVNGSVPRTTMTEAVSYPDQRKVIQYVVFADDTDADGHGTHVAGIAAGKVYDDWEVSWEKQVADTRCEDAGLIRSCFGDCVETTAAEFCHWNPELSCPLFDCDVDTSCDDDTGYDFPCFGDPADELPEASGVASDAKLAFFDIGNEDESLLIPDDIGDMWDSQYAAGARVMSNSWSLVTLTEPTARDVQLDKWVNDHPDTLVVFGAGNNGFQDGGFNPGSVQSPATGKTAMTVGASNSGPGRTYAYYSDAASDLEGVLWPSDETMFQVSAYSARGPVGRFTAKPDVVAPGLMVHSAKASLAGTDEETCALDSLGGTSMSAPAVAGAAALVRQYFEQGVLASFLEGVGLCGDKSNHTAVAVYEEAGLCEAFAPSGYLVKAVLVNSAMWLGGIQTVSYGNKSQWMSVLDFAQGFGAVQLADSMPTDGVPMGAFYHEHELASDDVHYYSVFVSDPGRNLSVTVVWFDPPSLVSSYNLLHDLDMFIMSVDTKQYFRANHFDTILALCVDDEACAQKYEFTFNNSLADDMNPVERIAVPSSELAEGYYVIGVRAHTLTESDVQAYGLAAAGGGLVLHDMSESWSDLDLGTQSSGGDGVDTEPDPDGSLHSRTPSPFALLEPDAPSSGTDAILAPTAAPVGSSSSVDDSADGNSNSTSSDISSMGDGGATHVTGQDDDARVAAEADGASGGSPLWGKVAIAAAAAAGTLLITIGCFVWCTKVRCFSKRKDDTSYFLCPERKAPAAFSGVAVGENAVAGADGHERAGDEGCGSDGQHDEEFEEHLRFYSGMPPLVPASSIGLPGYATAVARVPEEEGLTIIRDPTGVEQVVELTARDESEVSSFYAAVDSGAVETLVSWGINRDFARVALHKTDNDVQDALKLIAEGNMDQLLAMDHQAMAREGKEAGAAAAAATPAATSVHHEISLV